MPPSDADPNEPLGLIAGNGSFPVAVARAARASGRRVVAVAHEGETDRALEAEAAVVTWVRVGQAGRVLKALQAGGVREAVMIGGITKTSFFDGARLDTLGMRLVARVAVRSDDNLLRALAREFEANGVRIVPSAPWLTGLGAPSGVLGREQPTAEELSDVRYGFRLAKDLGRFDVGQTVVVKKGVPLALEAIEGTDACIARGGTLAKGDAVVVKVVKPGQDRRFDLPAAGAETVRVCARNGVRVLAVEAGATILMDRDEMVRLADRAKIVLVGVSAEEAGS
jgi:hypothetical protein